MTDRSPEAPSWEESMELLDRLPGLSLDERATAVERLLRNASPGVRERALRMGAAVLPESTLLDYLRSEADSIRRNAGLEILKLRGGRSYSAAVELLDDGDDDVVLQGVLVLDHLRDPRALEPLRAVLSHDDPNVIQAAIIAVGHLGDARAIPDLLPYLDADPWLQMAAVQALGELRSPQAVPALRKRLTDLMIGQLAAEALARIGGGNAFRSLASHWLRYHEQLDPETILGLLAHVVEGLARAPRPWEELRAGLAERLRDPYAGVRVSAARCLLALGAGPEDAEALSVVAGHAADRAPLPSCLVRRSDLIDALLERRGHQRRWGYLLAARHPAQVETAVLATALGQEVDPELAEPIAALLRKLRRPELAEPLLELYLRLPAETRTDLVPALRALKGALDGVLERRQDLGAADRLVLGALLGEPPAQTAERLVELPPAERSQAILQLADRPAVLRRLPWERWLEEEPEEHAELAARMAVAAGLRQLLPSLRRALVVTPTPDLIRAAGELGDRDSVQPLLDHLEEGDPRLGPMIVESLGRIGGPAARRALHRILEGHDGELERHAYRALGACAVGEDEPIFRDAITHPDWLVRLASADVLGRFTRPRNLAALTQLAADPVTIVARRALSFLER